uniref:Transposase n=1 Tax=Heterorhabditis bacteriophora TaxID=37862 RepID=A0A1I7XFV3_HETBA
MSDGIQQILNEIGLLAHDTLFRQNTTAVPMATITMGSNPHISSGKHLAAHTETNSGDTTKSNKLRTT